MSSDFLRYETDIQAFAIEVLGLTKGLNPGQLRFLRTMGERRDRWTPRWLTVFLASGNRAGKTLALAVFIIHSCLFKTNLESTWEDHGPKAAERKAKAEYHAYHFGIAHEVADLVYSEITRLLTGMHPGQLEGKTALPPDTADWSSKEYGDYHWIKFINNSEVHFRTTSEKSLGQLGKDMHLITMDEAGLEARLDFLIDEVFDFRRLGTGGQLACVSTPSEDLGYAFQDRWEDGNPDNPDRKPNWYSLRMTSMENIGFGLTQTMFDIVTEGLKPGDRKWDQNILGIFLQARAAYFNGTNADRAFIPGMLEQTHARKGLTYVVGIDPAKTKDSAWAIVLAVVPNPDRDRGPFLIGVKASQKKGQKSTEDLVSMAADAYNAYDVKRLGSTCYIATDATGFGGKLFREALDKEVPNVTNVEFGGTIQKKRKLLGDLRTIIDEGRLLLPKEGVWLSVRKQLLAYKLVDKGIEQDAVMALVCAVYLVPRVGISGQSRSVSTEGTE